MAKKKKIGFALAQSFETLCADTTLPTLGEALAVAETDQGIFKIKWDGSDIRTAQLLETVREAT